MLFAFVLLAAACGSSDDDDAAAPTEAPGTTESMDDMDDDADHADDDMDDMDDHADDDMDDMDDDDMDDMDDDDMDDMDDDMDNMDSDDMDDMDDDMDDMDDMEMMDLSGTEVSVFGPESSDEEAGALQDALDHFSAQTGIEIRYTGARDAADQINAQVAGGNPPDIFVFPQPGKLAGFARDGHLLALPDDVSASMSEHWSSAWTAFGDVDGTQYGVPTKSDLKSLVWYKPARFASNGYSVPGTWDELKALTAEMISNGHTPFCIGIESGPATGWTFTDWVEDLMLRFHTPADYDAWVAGDLAFASDKVSGVFTEVLDLWNTPGMVFASGGSIAATPFGDNGRPLVDDDCMMHRQASFYAAFLPEGTVFADGSADAVDTFYFPSVRGDQPVLGAGTLVGAFRDAPEVWAVMKYFASSEYAEVRQQAQTGRKGGGLSGFLSGAQNQDPSVYQPLEQSFLSILQNADVVRFDGSDLMPAEVGAGTFWSEGTAVVNGDKTVAEATKAIDESWPR